MSNCDTTKCDVSDCDMSKCDSNSCELPSVAKENNTDETEFSMKEGAPMNKINLLEVDIDSTNTALNVMVGFLGLAQKRGAFAINESAKLYECIEKFT
jgi:hypothetical protein